MKHFCNLLYNTFLNKCLLDSGAVHDKKNWKKGKAGKACKPGKEEPACEGDAKPEAGAAKGDASKSEAEGDAPPVKSEGGGAAKVDHGTGGDSTKYDIGASGVRAGEKKKLDFEGKTVLAPLTTVGNLPFRLVRDIVFTVKLHSTKLVVVVVDGLRLDFSVYTFVGTPRVRR